MSSDIQSYALALHLIDVAVRWGFKHMSRFAEEYGALFGERPSETLRRA